MGPARYMVKALAIKPDNQVPPRNHMTEGEEDSQKSSSDTHTCLNNFLSYIWENQPFVDVCCCKCYTQTEIQARTGWSFNYSGQFSKRTENTNDS